MIAFDGIWRRVSALGVFRDESPQARFWWACTLAVVLAVLALALALLAWRTHSLAQTAVAQSEAARLEWSRLNEPPTHAQPATAPSHPALALAAQPEADLVVQRLEQAARMARVVIRRVEATRVPPSATELGRLQLAVVAEGSYADLKRWMAEWTARLPAATISQLRLQRPESTPTTVPMLEWSGTVTVWSRPIAPGRS